MLVIACIQNESKPNSNEQTPGTEFSLRTDAI